MKKFLQGCCFFYLFLSLTHLQAQAIMDFGGEANETYDFGIVEEGNTISYEFQFVNSGDEALTIVYASASCGCTTPYWTKTAVGQGEKGFVKAAFNTAGRLGLFKKAITVKSNAIGGMKVLFITGNIIPKNKVESKEKEVDSGRKDQLMMPHYEEKIDFSKNMYRRSSLSAGNFSK